MVEGEGQPVPFDMAKETLKSIREWIDKISQLSLGYFGGTVIPPNELIRTKKKMVEQLIVLASPLIEKDLEEIELFFYNIKLKVGNVKLPNGWERGVKVYSPEADKELNECVKGIQKALSKYFIPEFKGGEKY